MQIIKEIDFSILPEEARRELIDFYEFLLENMLNEEKMQEKKRFFL